MAGHIIAIVGLVVGGLFVVTVIATHRCGHPQPAGTTDAGASRSVSRARPQHSRLAELGYPRDPSRWSTAR